jgi:hypothetical protein
MSKAVYNVTINVTVNGTADDVAQTVADAVKRELTKMSSQEFVSHAEELLGIAKSAQQPSAQCLRDEIVERAKRDVEYYAIYGYSQAGYYVDFVVNREKRTIVALIRDPLTDEVFARGIAKCAPGDVFNSHIGRAIALRRALGLPVPVKYLNAPQPTEVRVGDVVEITGNQQSGHFYHYYSIGDTGRVDKVGRYEGGIVVTPVKTRERKCPGYYQNVSLLDVKIIDDSREETEVSA